MFSQAMLNSVHDWNGLNLEMKFVASASFRILSYSVVCQVLLHGNDNGGNVIFDILTRLMYSLLDG